MVLKQVQCPPKGLNNKGVSLLFKKWIPSMEKYAGDYIGLGDITGSTSNKEAKKVAIGNNKFIHMGEKCDSTSEAECVGKDKYMYMRSYPLGKIPICKEKTKIIDSIETKEYNHEGNIDLIGGTGLMGNLQEEIINLPIYDYFSATFNKTGPFASKSCMKATLPVGNGIAVNGRKFSNKEDAIINGRGWWVESHCIPKEPTFDKRYGGEIFKIPFSKSRCIKELPKITEKFKIVSTDRISNHNNYFFITIISFFILLSIIKNGYINAKKKFILILIVFCLGALLATMKYIRSGMGQITHQLKRKVIPDSFTNLIQYFFIKNNKND